MTNATAAQSTTLDESDARAADDDRSEKTKNQEEEVTTEKKNHDKSAAHCRSKKLFVANLHPRVAKVHLEKLLQPYGSIVDLQVAYQKSTGKPRGYAFCEYATLDEAASAIAALHGRTLLGRNLVVQCSKPKDLSNSVDVSTSSTTGVVDRRKLDDKIQKLRSALNQHT